MNNSKENILKRIAAAGMPEYAYPDFGYEPQHFDDPAAVSYTHLTLPTIA